MTQVLVVRTRSPVPGVILNPGRAEISFSVINLTDGCTDVVRQNREIPIGNMSLL